MKCCISLFCKDYKDIERVENMSNPKQMIHIYQIWRSKLVFTLVELMLNNILQPIFTTSVMSQIMCDEKSEQRSKSTFNEY